MDTVYRNALRVSVWLGLSPLAQPHEKFQDSRIDWSDAVEVLANRAYWSRVWVIQEVLLGLTVDLYCGSNRLEWSYFREIIQIFEDQADKLDYGSNGFDPARHQARLWAVRPFIVGRHHKRYPGLRESLFELVLRHGQSKCKDPRDRVFALLGLVHTDERAWLERFFPDYTMSQNDVVVIALSHMQHINTDYDDRYIQRLLLGLGVRSQSRQRCLARRAKMFNYLGDQLPSECPWMAEEEAYEDEPHEDYMDEEITDQEELQREDLGHERMTLEQEMAQIYNYGQDAVERAETDFWMIILSIAYVLSHVFILVVVLRVYHPRGGKAIDLVRLDGPT
jgi:hypothetical protein